MLLLRKQNFILESDSRLVKATDMAVAKSAAEIISTAEENAAKIREDAKAAYEEEKKRGYADGLQEGKLEISTRLLDMLDQSVEFMESVERKMADVVMKALKSCVEEIGDEEMVVNIVRKTMKAVIRTQRHVTLKVAPEMVPVVKERVAALRIDFPTVESFDVVEDVRLSGPACILETEAGVADASVETQLAAIERSLKRHMAVK